MSDDIKTVYILGAGFSNDAGFPLQGQILQTIFSYDLNILSGDNRDEFLRISEIFLPAITRVKNFLTKIYPPNTIPPLEDCFTLLDQTISERGHCAGYSWKDLEDVRASLNWVILFVFHERIKHMQAKAAEFYRRIAAHWILERVDGGIEKDRLSIISLNWDSLVEESVYWCIENVKALGKIDIDYCCYTTPLGSSCPHTSSILQKAKGIFNIKLLKLHGSSNWKRCPNCSRLYTGVGSKDNIWDLYALPRSCRYCLRRPAAEETHENVANLESFFISPTYLKTFNNSHIQSIWHNAYVELAEADRIVFIGYSLPEADYYLRSLIKRAVQADAEIHVVLLDRDRPRQQTPKNLRSFFAATRYEQFFGAGKVNYHFGGAKGYFKKNIKYKTLQGQNVAIKARLGKSPKKS